MSYVLYVEQMSTTPHSIPALIDLWPTIAEFSSDVGCGYEAARQMRRRGSIAPEHWPRVIAASKRRSIKGVTLDWLTKQRAALAEAVQ